eukprot:6197108-Pleurochrysis_carterae.AAC.5
MRAARVRVAGRPISQHHQPAFPRCGVDATVRSRVPVRKPKFGAVRLDNFESQDRPRQKRQQYLWYSILH